MLYTSRLLLEVNMLVMKELATKILNALPGKLIGMLTQLIACLNQVIKLLNDRRQDKKEAAEEKKDEKFDKVVDKVVDKGSLDDLLNLNREDIR